jgi:hypothetical protein
MPLRVPVHPPRFSRFLAAAVALAFGACSSDDVTAPPPPAEGSFTVNASQGWVYVSIADSAVVTPTPSAGESSAWDLAFFATGVTLNGGEAGPGGVTGFCVCQNEQATNAEVLAMTPESERGDFDAVTAVPGNATFVADVLTPAISGWFTGSATAAVADPGKSFLVRLSDSVAYAKVRVAELESPTATSAGRVTLEYAVQPSATDPLGATQTLTVDLATGAKNIDLQTGSETTNAAEWDLRLEKFTIRVNGSVSGPGKGGAATTTESFESITTAKTADQAYQVDRFAGVFGASPYYRYNILGDNRISPNFNVYLIKRGTAVYKLQVLSYYNPASPTQARYITFRYEQIAQ